MHFPNFESADGADATSPAIDHQPTAEFAQVDRVPNATTPISIDFDANRLALLKRAKFQGPSYQKFTDELWLYARPVLLSKLRSGLIFAWCAEGGVAVSPTSAERDVLHRSPEDRDHLVIDTIAHAIPKFRIKVLTKDKWDPAGAANMATYFVNFCRFEFQAVFRNWQRQRRKALASLDVTELEPGTLAHFFYQPNFDPEKQAITRDDIAHLTRNSPEQTRWICVLMLEGYTHSEIADRLGITVRRIEYLLHKLRKRALKMSAAGVIDPPKWVQARPPASREAA